MKNLHSLGLRVEQDRVLVLDQQQLPQKEIWLEAENVDQMVEYIRALKVRGAPLIGVAAAISLAKAAMDGLSHDELRRAAAALRAARPTAVNLMAAVDRMLKSVDSKSKFIHEAECIFEEDVDLCEKMSTFGAGLVKEGETLLTHCNAGGLATVGIGTAIGVIRKAHEQGKKIKVYVDETRPLLQGARLTAWELEKLGVPYTLICDNMAATLMHQKAIQRVFVGADRVAANGDFANKIGTYGVAVNAHHHGIPFHPVAPWTTVDLACPTGTQIPIEERAPEEVRGAIGAFGKVEWAPTRSKVFNPAFDVTPNDLVTSLVLDRGVFTRDRLKAGSLSAIRSAEPAL